MHYAAQRADKNVEVVQLIVQLNPDGSTTPVKGASGITTTPSTPNTGSLKLDKLKGALRSLWGKKE